MAGGEALGFWTRGLTPGPVKVWLHQERRRHTINCLQGEAPTVFEALVPVVVLTAVVVVLVSPCYTTCPLTSCHCLPPSILPSCSLFPRTGRGAEADSGEPLLWQLPSEWRAEGESDIIWQWPTQSSGTWQKPVRWEEAATAAHVEVLFVNFKNIFHLFFLFVFLGGK